MTTMLIAAFDALEESEDLRLADADGTEEQHDPGEADEADGDRTT